jgi:hypothetical protein
MRPCSASVDGPSKLKKLTRSVAAIAGLLPLLSDMLPPWRNTGRASSWPFGSALALQACAGRCLHRRAYDSGRFSSQDLDKGGPA